MTEKTLLDRIFEIATTPKLPATKAIIKALEYGPRFTPHHIHISDEERAEVLNQPVEKILGGGLLVDPLGDYLKHHFFRRVGDDEFILSKLDYSDLEKFLVSQFRVWPNVINNTAAQLYDELALDEETDGEAIQGLAALLDELEPVFQSEEAWESFSQGLQDLARPAIAEAVRKARVFVKGLGNAEITIHPTGGPETVTWSTQNAQGLVLSGQCSDIREAWQAARAALALPPAQFVARACQAELATLRQAARDLVANGFPLDLKGLEALVDQAKVRMLSTVSHLHVVVTNEKE